MPEIILFTQPDCEKCDYVKDHMPDGVEINILDIKSVDGMAEAAYYELAGKHTPILVADDEVVEGAIKIRKTLEKLAKA